MSKMSKAIVALGVVAGLGVAAMPLSSYAATTTGKVEIVVDGAISVAIVEPTNKTDDTDGVSLDGSTLKLGTAMIGATPTVGTMGVQVKTNATSGYKLTINATTTTDMVGKNESNTIPANAAVDQGKAGWAFKGGDVINKTAITIDPITLKSTNAAISGEAGEDQKKAETTDVTFIVAADSSTPEDTYTGTVVFTATVN